MIKRSMWVIVRLPHEEEEEQYSQNATIGAEDTNTWKYVEYKKLKRYV